MTCGLFHATVLDAAKTGADPTCSAMNACTLLRGMGWLSKKPCTKSQFSSSMTAIWWSVSTPFAVDEIPDDYLCLRCAPVLQG